MKTSFYKDRYEQTLRMDSSKKGITLSYGPNLDLFKSDQSKLSSVRRAYIASYNFESSELWKLYNDLLEESIKLWGDINPTQLSSIEVYSRVYNKDLQVEEILAFHNNRLYLRILSPESDNSSLMYNFTKERAEAFLYDLKNKINEECAYV